MKLFEIKHNIIPLNEQELRESIALDFVSLYQTYGSWMHAQHDEPIYVKRVQGHPEAAKKIVPGTDEPDELHSSMFKQGWVRLVHNKMQSIVLTGTAEAIGALLPRVAEFRNACNRIVLELEDCSGEFCQAAMTRKYEMPTQWPALKQAVG